jgi:hypothetical protein
LIITTQTAEEVFSQEINIRITIVGDFKTIIIIGSFLVIIAEILIIIVIIIIEIMVENIKEGIRMVVLITIIIRLEEMIVILEMNMNLSVRK